MLFSFSFILCGLLLAGKIFHLLEFLSRIFVRVQLTLSPFSSSGHIIHGDEVGSDWNYLNSVTSESLLNMLCSYL